MQLISYSMRRYVIGDIHGAHKALKQCLEGSNFNYDEDLLICLGDVCDGWPESRQCIDELLKINNLILVLGNHDQWALEWMKGGSELPAWLAQGGRQTIESYGGMPVPEQHIKLLEEAPLYVIEDNKLFVHAGINPALPIEEQDEHTLLWGRDFYATIIKYLNEKQAHSFTDYEEIYMGHTPVHRIGYFEPVNIGEVWLMDTGAAWEGTLSMIDIDTKKAVISDKPVDMYPAGSGRF